MPWKAPNWSLRGLAWFLPRLLTTTLSLLFALVAFVFALAAVLMRSLSEVMATYS